MSTTSSFEILSLKSGKWETEGIDTDKSSAIQHAQEALKSRFLTAVKIIEERYDEETGESNSFIIFNKKKTFTKTKSRYTGPERRKGKEWRDVKKYHTKRKKNRRKVDFVSEIIKLVVVLGGILFGIVVLVYFYISVLGG